MSLNPGHFELGVRSTSAEVVLDQKIHASEENAANNGPQQCNICTMLCLLSPCGIVALISNFLPISCVRELNLHEELAYN